MTFQFAWPWLFAALPLPLLAWWLLLPKADTQPPQAIRMPLYVSLRQQTGDATHASPRPRHWRLGTAVLVWLLLVAAAARPQAIGEPMALPQNGRNLMLAVDLSGSMQEPDMMLGGQQISRLTAVKAVAGDFIKRRAGDRVGLILFGQQAYTSGK